MATGSNGFGGYAEAMEMRDIVNAMVKKSLDDNRPAPTFARVYSIDSVARTCMVVINGDTVAIKAVCGSIVPSFNDQIVRLEGPPGARYVADVLGPDRIETQTFGNSPWLSPALGTGFTFNSINPLRYRLVEDHGGRTIQLKGQLDGGNGNTTMFQVAAGYRPVVNLQSVLIGRNISGGSAVAQMIVNADGTCLLNGGTTGLNNQTATGVGGNSANTSDVLPTGGSSSNANRGQTSGPTTVVNSGDTTHKHLFEHVHQGGSHQHTLASVVAPTNVYFDGVSYCI